MSIEKVSGRLSVDESAALAENISKGLKVNTTEDAFVLQKQSAIADLSSNLTYSIMQNRAKEHTKLLYNQDKIRDKLFSALKLFIKAYLSWDKNTNIAMAQRLQDIINKHGTHMDRLSYNAQTARMDSLLTEFEAEAIIEAIEALGLGELVADIKLAQDTFTSSFSDARNTEAQKEEILSASALKKVLKTEVDTLSSYLSMMLISQGDSYKPLYNIVETHITEANNSVN